MASEGVVLILTVILMAALVLPILLAGGYTLRWAVKSNFTALVFTIVALVIVILFGS